MRRKYDVYFGTWMGMVSSPCPWGGVRGGAAARRAATPAATDLVGLARPLNAAAAALVLGAAAAVIYCRRCRIRGRPELVIHHLLSIPRHPGRAGLHAAPPVCT